MLILKRLTFVLTLVLLANFGIWAAVNQSVSERAYGGSINGLSYSGYKSGDREHRLTDEQIDRDMEVLSGHTMAVRI